MVVLPNLCESIVDVFPKLLIYVLWKAALWRLDLNIRICLAHSAQDSTAACSKKWEKKVWNTRNNLHSHFQFDSWWYCIQLKRDAENMTELNGSSFETWNRTQGLDTGPASTMEYFVYGLNIFFVPVILLVGVVGTYVSIIDIFWTRLLSSVCSRPPYPWEKWVYLLLKSNFCYQYQREPKLAIIKANSHICSCNSALLPEHVLSYKCSLTAEKCLVTNLALFWWFTTTMVVTSGGHAGICLQAWLGMFWQCQFILFSIWSILASSWCWCVKRMIF